MVRSLFVFGWCLSQKYLSLYILTLIKLLYKHQIMFWNYGSFDIVTIILWHSFCTLYHVWLCSCHPEDLLLLSSYLSLTMQLVKGICKVIKYNFIKIIKSEPTFSKTSTHDQSSLSNREENFTRYQL